MHEKFPLFCTGAKACVWINPLLFHSPLLRSFAFKGKLGFNFFPSSSVRHSSSRIGNLPARCPPFPPLSSHLHRNHAVLPLTSMCYVVVECMYFVPCFTTYHHLPTYAPDWLRCRYVGQAAAIEVPLRKHMYVVRMIARAGESYE